MTEEEVHAEIDNALQDAKIAADAVRFYHLKELGQGHVGGGWFHPHLDIEANDPAFPDDTQREEANLPENRCLHRIAVPAKPVDPVLFAARVRHELEHANQFDAGVGIPQCHDFVRDRVLAEIADDLKGCGGALINSIPTEVDCNAAASIYIQQRYSEREVQAIRDGPQSQLACSLIPPPPPETLPARMVAFAFVYCAAVERHAERSHWTLDSTLSLMHPRAMALWTQLEQGL